jgi:hypothetical protein
MAPETSQGNPQITQITQIPQVRFRAKLEPRVYLTDMRPKVESQLMKTRESTLPLMLVRFLESTPLASS